MHYKTTEQWAGLLSSVTSLCYFIQAALEEKCSEGHRSSAIYMAMGINVIFLTAAMWYGIIKEKIFLLKLYIIITFMMGLGCLFVPAVGRPASYGDHCYVAKFEPVVIGILQLVTVGVVWRTLYVMSHPSTTATSTDVEASTDTTVPEPVKNDDPPSYNDVVFFRSFSAPPEKSAAFTVPLSCEGSLELPFSYGSLNSMPPSYYFAVTQAQQQGASSAQHPFLSGSGSADFNPPNSISGFNINEYWNTPADNN